MSIERLWCFNLNANDVIASSDNSLIILRGKPLSFSFYALSHSGNFVFIFTSGKNYLEGEAQRISLSSSINSLSNCSALPAAYLVYLPTL